MRRDNAFGKLMRLALLLWTAGILAWSCADLTQASVATIDLETGSAEHQRIIAHIGDTVLVHGALWLLGFVPGALLYAVLGRSDVGRSTDESRERGMRGPP